MKFEFHPEALQEYEEAIDYHLQINKRLANLFVSEIEKKVKLILERPKSYPILRKDVRRCLLELLKN